MRIALPLALVALLSFTAQARTLEGVTLPDQVTIEGKTLTLNGAGLRTKTIFNVKVYVIGLYLPQPIHTAQAAVSLDAPKQIQMVLKRDVDQKAIGDAISEGFDRNSKQDLPKLRMRLLELRAAIPNLKEGQKLVFTYLPGKGTVLGGAAKPTVIEGKDFYDALLSCWLGNEPADGDLKNQLLGKK